MLPQIFTFITLFFVLLFTLEDLVLAQNVVPDCPETFSLASNSEPIREGDIVTFTANVSSKNPPITYNWAISAGTILSGQGTSSIQIETSNLGAIQVTATVQLGNIDSRCKNTESITISITSKPRYSMVEGFTQKGNEAKSRLDLLVGMLKDNPTSRTALVAYSRYRKNITEAEVRLEFAYKYLIDKGIEPDRIVTLNGGNASEAITQVFIIPAGADDGSLPNSVLRPSLKTVVKRKVNNTLQIVENAKITVKLDGDTIKSGLTDSSGVSLIILNIRGNHKVKACEENGKCSDEKEVKVNDNVQFTVNLTIP